MVNNNFWHLFAGLGIFLFGMSQLEDTMKQLAGRTFKLFLRKHTNNPFNAILSGTFVTALLQSSSVVTLMTLTFVGAGILSMRNALGVVLGANLGTTLDNWIVVSIGFKLDIEHYVLPLIAFSGMGLVLLARRKKAFLVCRFGMGFGLLFLGLSDMKSSFDSLVTQFDFTPYAHNPLWFFVVAGFLVTAIIQASSATMMITLSALNSGIIPFESAVAVIIGSELGTTIKTIIGAAGSVAAKKRVALGNIIFNAVTVVIAYLLIHPIIHLIHFLIGASDSLTGLVLFQTLINLAGIIMFMPFLRRFGDFLERRFVTAGVSATNYLPTASTSMPSLALEIIEKETYFFIQRVIHLNEASFNIHNTSEIEITKTTSLEKREKQLHSFSEKYDFVKQAEGEILSFYSKLTEEKIQTNDRMRLDALMEAVRNAMYSAKGMKDIRQDRKDLRDSVLDVKYAHYKLIQQQLQQFYNRLNSVIQQTQKTIGVDDLTELMKQINSDYESRFDNIYHELEKGALEKLDISTLLNVNREIYSSCKAIILASKNFLLDKVQRDAFDEKVFSLLK